MKISNTIITWNRKEMVQKCVSENIRRCGRMWDELIWVDNGSHDGTDELARSFSPDVLVLNSKNLGVSKAWNRAFALCTGDWIMACGDRNLHPENWLGILSTIADTGEVDAICIWDCDIYGCPERHRPGELKSIGGYDCLPSIAFGSILFRRSILSNCGYFREDLGMYGWNDVEWASRLLTRNTRSFVLTQYKDSRMPDIEVTVPGRQESYRKWRDLEINDPRKKEVLSWCQKNGHPYYNPYT